MVFREEAFCYGGTDLILPRLFITFNCSFQASASTGYNLLCFITCSNHHDTHFSLHWGSVWLLTSPLSRPSVVQVHFDFNVFSSSPSSNLNSAKMRPGCDVREESICTCNHNLHSHGIHLSSRNHPFILSTANFSF